MLIHFIQLQEIDMCHVLFKRIYIYIHIYIYVYMYIYIISPIYSLGVTLMRMDIFSAWAFLPMTDDPSRHQRLRAYSLHEVRQKRLIQLWPFISYKML